MWKIDGPDRGHHFPNCYQHGLARDCLGDHFEKSEARKKTLSGICGKVMVLIGAIIPPTLTNVVWQGIFLGTIFEKMRPWRKPY